MKKIIVASALTLALTGAAFAANPNTAATPAAPAANAQTVCPEARNCRTEAPRFNPFDGIQLTDDQQTAITNLNAQQCQNRENARAERRQRAEAARTEGNQSRRDYLTSLKGILTPEQYVTFLENCYVNAGPGRHEGNKPRRQERADRNGRRMQSAPAANANATATRSR